ncbi:unnamed protein product [Thlaspi arvense]|uniref:Uncharacterized protein n=1 Tax=Thlaspi arvense TaxID=13288 RepID=A0AAU9RMK0_THLAR|nr:unnamed protein product [Thlaspi arvense]
MVFLLEKLIAGSPVLENITMEFSTYVSQILFPGGQFFLDQCVFIIDSELY